jgi:hypothetical protein
MADRNGQAQALAAELSAANFQADDLSNLARNVYVRCLLKVHGIAGRNMSAKVIALKITAHVLQQKVGFHFTAADVQSLLDENGAPA